MGNELVALCRTFAQPLDQSLYIVSHLNGPFPKAMASPMTTQMAGSPKMKTPHAKSVIPGSSAGEKGEDERGVAQMVVHRFVVAVRVVGFEREQPNALGFGLVPLRRFPYPVLVGLGGDGWQSSGPAQQFVCDRIVNRGAAGRGGVDRSA